MDRRSFLKKSVRLCGAAAACSAALSGSAGITQAQSLKDILKSLDAPATGVFGTTEIASNSFSALPQWARVLKEMRSQKIAFDLCLASDQKCATPGQKSWRQIILQARGQSRVRQLDMVNRFFNRWPYKFDQEIYGTSEYWASPQEFMRRSGDCEDYSIAKFFVLRELGFTSNELRVVILLDRIRNIGHAVLAVYTNNDILILDSLSDVILSHSKYKHYIPQYSMNEKTRWAHIRS